jgi:hypothetical protein
MAVFRDPKKLQAHLKKALDALQAETLITTQAQLGSDAVSPVDTGRFRSSWFAAEGQASSEVASEGANNPNTDATGLRVDSRKNYHLTNSLPYAQSVAVEGRVVSKPTNWFTSFRNEAIPKIQDDAAKKIKSKFEL